MNNTQADFRILVVDDEADVNALMVETLSRAKFSLEAAFNGKDALAIVESSEPDLLVCDLVMPVMNGVDTIRESRKARPQIKILAVSGGSRLGGGPTLDDALAAGADAVLRKPFGARELLSAVNALLAEAGATEQDTHANRTGSP